jgi:MFS family permease
MTRIVRPHEQDWRVLVAIFWLTSLVEGIGVSQIFALLPAYLRGMGVADGDRLAFVGLFSSLIFVVGAPLVPVWGVWADKYSRKAVIVRSAIVEAVVFGAVALSREPWQLAASLLLIGLQLGNTGVMLAGIRDVSPKRRLGTVIALFGASGPVGFAVGPALAGVFVDRLGWSLSEVFASSAVLSIATAVLVTFGSREVRPEVVPEGRVLALAYGAIRGVLADPAVRRIFAIFGVSFLATQMSRPYVPILVEGIVGHGEGLTSAIALVAGTAALVGALVSPAGGAIGDRIGFRPVLLGALFGGAAALVLMPRSEAEKRGIAPLAEIRAHASHAQAPSEFPTAPIGALQKLMAKTGWSFADVDLFEINEAFAVVTMAAIRELSLPPEKVNVHGGACALGHPIGASGARIVVTLLAALQKYGLKRGAAALCIGGGEATALAIEVPGFWL